MQLLAQCVFWLAVVLLGSMVAGLVVAQAVAQGEWQMVQDHCQRDVERVMALAQRLRVVDLRDVDREAVQS